MSPHNLSPQDQAELSAYLDGELDPRDTARIRERVARDAEFADALHALEALDRELRSIPPAEVAPELGERMRARIAAETRGAQFHHLDPLDRSGQSDQSDPLAPMRRAPRRPRSARPLFYAAAAVAATVALAFLIRAQIAGGPTPRVAPLPEPVLPQEQPLEERALPELGESEGRELLAPVPPGPAETAPVPEVLQVTPKPEAGVTPDRLAERPVAPSPTKGPVAPSPAAEPRAIPAVAERVVPPDADALGEATDEELLIALGLEALGAEDAEPEDLAIIEQLEFVELLRALEAGERRG